MKKTIDSPGGTASLDQVRRESCNDGPFERSSAETEQHRSRSHGNENEWEETHSDEEGQSSQRREEDCARREKDGTQNRAGRTQDGAQDRRRQEEGPGAQDCREAGDRAQDDRKEDLRAQDDSAETGSAQSTGAQARSGCEEAVGCAEAGSRGVDRPAARNVIARRSETGRAPGATGASRASAFAWIGKPIAAPGRAARRRQCTVAVSAASRYARGSAKLKSKPEPKSAALPAVLGARRRRYVRLRGRAGA